MAASLGRRERDRRLRESDIFKAAEYVFAIRGYHKATVIEIAQKAQYGVGTVYLYFKDKQNLYFRLVEEKMEKMTVFIKEEASKSPDTIGKLEAMVKARLKFFDENRDFFRIYFTERSSFKSRLRDKMGEKMLNKYLKYAEFVVFLIKKGISERKLKNLDPQKLAFALLGNINSMIFQSLIHDKNGKPLLNYKGFIMDLFLNGAAQKKLTIK